MQASLLEAYAPKIEETVARLLEQDPAGGLGLPMDIGSPPADIGAPLATLALHESRRMETPATFPENKDETYLMLSTLLPLILVMIAR